MEISIFQKKELTFGIIETLELHQKIKLSF